MILVTLLALAQILFATENCSPQKLQEILAPASDTDFRVDIDCDLQLQKGQTVSKKIRIFKSDISIDCNGAELRPSLTKGGYTVSVFSPKIGDRWQQVENIQIKNCYIYGRIKVYGMATSGEGEHLRESSYSLGHTLRSQNFAPKNVVFDNNVFYATGAIPLYFSPGVTYSKVTKSFFIGHSRGTALYLDAESAFNEVSHNIFNVKTTRREQLAVDGSAYNLIRDNKFLNLEHGGIFLYRNCGEGGTVRHQSPMYNQILNNQFEYLPGQRQGSIVLASRNGLRLYCWFDRGYPFGSSADDRDFAQYNFVAQNQFLNRPVDKALIDNDLHNFSIDNENVTSFTKRSANCFSYSPSSTYIQDKDYFAYLFPNGKAAKYLCEDGVLSKGSYETPLKVSFKCLQNGNYEGCSKKVVCPSGRKLIGLKARCDLETGIISGVDNLNWNSIEVNKVSYFPFNGHCQFGDKKYMSLQTYSANNHIKNQEYIDVKCREFDLDGGDCAVEGEILCL